MKKTKKNKKDKKKQKKDKTKNPKKRTKNFFLSIPAKRHLLEAEYPPNPVKKIETKHPANR